MLCLNLLCYSVECLKAQYWAKSSALLLASHAVNGQFYADDCQIYLPTVNIDENKTKVLALLSDIKTWLREQKLKLNESKTEIMLIKVI